MPYDIASALQQATSVGAGVGQAMLSSTIRMQQLRSEQALRQLDERIKAQQLAYAMEAHDLQVQERADLTKAMARVQAETAPQMFQPPMDPSQIGMLALPEAEREVPGAPMAQTLVKHIFPIVQKYHPDKASDWLADITLYDQRSRMSNPEMREVVDPVTGQKRSMARTGPNSWQLVQPDVAQRQQAAFSRAEMGKMVDWVRKERPDLLGQLQRDGAGNLQVPQELIGEVAKQAGITTKTRTDLEAAEIGADNVFALGKELLPLINERTTGAKAEAKRALQRWGITALIPALDDPEISEAEAVGRTFTAGVIRALRSDGNINKDEVAALTHAAETINWQTEKGGKTKLASVIRRAADASRRAAQKKGTPVNPLFLTREEIRARVESGEFGDPNSEEAARKAIQAYQNTADNFLQSLEASLK